MATTPMPYISPEHYLELERQRESKSEYIDGVIYAMSGGLRAHSRLALRFGRALDARLTERGCETFHSDMQVAISAKGPFLFPDLSVACGDIPDVNGRGDLLGNPVLVVEVLSRSTEAYDRGRKFALYRQLKSLREYVLVSQTEPVVETFYRDDAGDWKLTDFAGMDAVCRLRSVDCEIPLREIYEGVRLSE